MWTVSGSKDERIMLVSSKDVDGILPVGSYLTVVDDSHVKHIMAVEESTQKSLFEPSPLIVDADLPILTQDQECKNIVVAREIKQFPLREDGLFSFIKPNERARRTTQAEIDDIFMSKDGYPVFLATNFLRQNASLRDDKGHLIFVRIPFDSLYLQTMICGQTGSGKTVAMKHIIEQFLEHEKGAVLAINVKSIDLLTMDQRTIIRNKSLEEQAEQEWGTLGLESKELGVFSIYVPSSRQECKEGVTRDKVTPITLKTRDLAPSALLGVLQNITDRAAEALPNIFRYWKDNFPDKTDKFTNFINWFVAYGRDHKRVFPTQSEAGETSEVPLHPGTYDAIIRSLETAKDFFDKDGCLPISEQNIMVSGKLSVIDLSSKDTIAFGAVLLRHLLTKIYEAKATLGQYPDLPILIVIDEVHLFYRSTASLEALKEFDAIARMGRSEKIGVIFSSQNPQDLPDGLTSIVNTRIFFRSLENVTSKFGMRNFPFELSSLGNGFAAISSYAVPQINFVKFPIPRRGVKA